MITTKRCALFLLMSLSMSFSALYSFESSARETNPDRAPRTQGVEPSSARRNQLTEIVNRRAAEAGVPAEFVRAVIRVESDWDQELTGHAGEVGLMQIKPSTAREMGYRGTDNALYDPDTNVRWGVAYLAAAYKLASGDICHTVLKYQAGHQAIKMTGAATAYCGRVRTIMSIASN